jgi:hypothetical protein
MIELIRSNYKIGLAVITVILIFSLYQSRAHWKSEAERERSNVANITKEHDRTLTLKQGEIDNINAVWKVKFDSVLKANNHSLKSIKSAMIVSLTYSVKGLTKVEYKPVVKQGEYFRIPVSVPEQCWGMKGYITSLDSTSKLDITERTSNNSVQRLEIKKRFLGFLWFTKKSEFKIYTDCGESDITNVNFVK